MDTSDVLKWVLGRIGFIRNNEKYIKGINLYNSFESPYGKDQYRIHFDIHPNFQDHITFSWDSLDKIKHLDLTESQKAENKIYNFATDYEKSWRGFSTQYNTEKEACVHYEWITEMVMHWLPTGESENKYSIEIKQFETQSFREYRLKSEREETERKRNETELLNKAFLDQYKFLGAPNDIALINHYDEEKLIQLDRVGITPDYPYAGMLLKKDMTPGKTRIFSIKEDDILVILTPEQVSRILETYPVTKTKEYFVKLINSKKSDVPKKYRR